MEDNQNQNNDNHENKELTVAEVIEKFKDNEDFNKYIADKIIESQAGLVKNRDALLAEVKDLKNFRKQAQEDEVTKLLTSGNPGDRQKAIDMLTADAVNPYKLLIEEKDNIIKQKEEFENSIKVERQKSVITEAYKKLSANSNIDDEAHKDILPVVFNNFKVSDKGELEFLGKDINKSGKPLSLEEFVVKHIEDGRKYYLKDRSGSNTVFKSSTDTANKKSDGPQDYKAFEAEQRAKYNR